MHGQMLFNAAMVSTNFAETHTTQRSDRPRVAVHCVQRAESAFSAAPFLGGCGALTMRFV